MATSGFLALWAWLAPGVAFLVLSLVVPLRRSGRPAAWLSIVVSLGSLGLTVAAWYVTVPDVAGRILYEWIAVEDGVLTAVGVLADERSTLMLILVGLVSFLVQVYSLGYLADETPASLGRYYAYQSLFAFSMMGLVLAPNFVQLFICWELVGLCSYLLIGYWFGRPEAARAAVKAFWVTKAGDAFFLAGIVMLWSRTGTFDFSELFELAQSGGEALTGLGLITFFIYLGAAGKSAQFPFHIWLPDAMEGPTPVSALIHAATMVTAGVYLLYRTVFLFEQTPEVLAAVGWIGAFTALLAATLACVQTDIKRVLAYSTVSQLGYMMAAIGAGFVGAGFLHLLTHGVFKALLFLAAGAVIHAVGTTDIFAMGGLARRMPQTFVVFLVGTFSLAGIPFFAGFFSKEEILGAAWVGGLSLPFGMLVLAAFLTAFYMLRVVFVAFLGAPAADRAAGHGHGPAHDAPAIMTAPLWFLAALAMAIGIGISVWHLEREFEPPTWLTPLAVGVALAGMVLAWLVYGLRVVSADRLYASLAWISEAATERFWLDDLFALVYRRVILGVSAGVGWVDRYIVDGILNVLSAWTLTAGDRLRRIQSGQAQDYVYGIALGVLLLMVWMRWPR